jgi:hypothetical protein
MNRTTALSILTAAVLLATAIVSAHAEPSLTVTVVTTPLTGSPGGLIEISGYLTNGSTPITGASVGVQATNSLDATVWVDTPVTDNTGRYHTSFTFPTGTPVQGCTAYACYQGTCAQSPFAIPIPEFPISAIILATAFFLAATAFKLQSRRSTARNELALPKTRRS